MKKKIFVLFILSFLFYSVNVFAYDWESKGWKIEKSEVNDDFSIIHLKKAKSNQISVKFYGKFPEEYGDKIISYFEEFKKWKNLQVSKIDFFVSNDILEMIISPKALKYNGMNIVPNLPSGLTFKTYGKSLKYNFRITKDNYFVRIVGTFTNEDALLTNVVSAINDPETYLKMREPEYFLKKLTELEEKYNNLKSEYDDFKAKMNKLHYAVLTLHNRGFLGIGVYPIKEKVIKKVIALKKANPKWGKKEIQKRLDKEKIKASGHEVFLILSIFFNDFGK